MPTAASCPSCEKAIRVPEGAVGKRIRCGGCEAVHRIEADAGGAIQLVPIESAPVEPAESDASCPACGAVLGADDTFCTECGANLDEAQEAERGKRTRARHRERRASNRRQGKMAKAGIWILVLGALFVVAGTLQGLSATREADTAYRQLDRLDPDDTLELEGEWLSVAEVRSQIEQEVTLAFGINYLLAAIMIALFFWSRSSPLPAIVTALCIYLVLIVSNAVFDPSTIVKGLLWKVLIISALVAGIQSALSERAAKERTGRRVARPRRAR